jgi:hypothetical protein
LDAVHLKVRAFKRVCTAETDCPYEDDTHDEQGDEAGEDDEARRGLAAQVEFESKV